MSMTVGGIASTIYARNSLAEKGYGYQRKQDTIEGATDSVELSEEGVNKAAESGSFAAVMRLAENGGEAFSQDISAVVDEIQNIESGKSENRDELTKLLMSVYDKTRSGGYAGALGLSSQGKSGILNLMA